jgi:hypothetical protein
MHKNNPNQQTTSLESGIPSVGSIVRMNMFILKLIEELFFKGLGCRTHSCTTSNQSLC